MYYGADVIGFQNADKLRKEMTVSEAKLWQRLSKSQLGVRVKSQHPIGLYIVDFYCHKAKMVIEVDGDIHFSETKQKEDIQRENEIELLGLKVIRFTNEEISKDIDSVIKVITDTITQRLQ